MAACKTVLLYIIIIKYILFITLKLRCSLLICTNNINSIVVYRLLCVLFPFHLGLCLDETPSRDQISGKSNSWKLAHGWREQKKSYESKIVIEKTPPVS